MTSTIEPKLAAPGAGLPAIELFIARALFALRRTTGNRDSFTATFRDERTAIEKRYRSCDTESAARRVLIRRLPGLEDSSRYWSVWMTLDHLRIVHQSIATVIGSLVKGVVPALASSTARVKPSPAANASVVAEYEKSCDALLATVAAAPDLKTRMRFAHPWFGPLDASGWHALAGAHIRIHRAQIDRIVTGQSTANQ